MIPAHNALNQTRCVQVFAKLGSIDRYKYVTGKEPLIQGLWPAFITPLTKDGEVDVAAVKPLCDYLIDECGVVRPQPVRVGLDQRPKLR